MTEPTPRRPRLQPRVLCGVVLIHAVVYWALVFQWQYVDQTWRVIALGIVLGQGSLFAMMAMLFARSIPVRVALPLSAALASWFGLAKIAQWGFGASGATWWAIAIAVQTIVCAAGAEVMREKVWHHFAAIADAAETRAPSLQFPIRSLIVLTTMSAIGFAVIRYGQRSGWWSPESLEIDENLMMTAVGLILATAALMVVFGFLSRRTHVIAIRMAAVIVSVPVMGYLLNAGAVRAGLSGGSDFRLTIVMLAAHVTCVLLTWVIVYWFPPYPASFSTNGIMSDS